MQHHVDLIIVSYNSNGRIFSCINSICQHTSYPYQLIVVDNNSSDGTANQLKKDKGLRLVALNKNIGYAGGANRGINAGNGDYIFILNQDIIVTHGWLEPLVQCLKSSPSIAVVGPKMITPDGRIASAGVVGTELNPKLRGFLEPDRPDRYNKVESCVSVLGACYGIKRSLLPVIGYFDESFFMYFEETDYSFRVRSLGYQVVYCPLSCIYHDMRWEQRNHAASAEMFARSQEIFNRKWQNRLRSRTHSNANHDWRGSRISSKKNYSICKGCTYSVIVPEI